ncbi:MAG: hypothetical protein ACXAD7_13245 [Candidatus Kariarchaeaceae archaeon]|jgi:hypothetical protein
MDESLDTQRTVLMLNVTNLKNNLAYPYAFVQVSEIADRFNIKVVRRDMYPIPQNQWKEYLQSVLNKNEMCMILITVRNTDTFEYEEYQIIEQEIDYHQKFYGTTLVRSKPNYFPATQTKHLVSILREITPLPIVLGGYAFSLLPDNMMRYIKPDYGVIGGPDDFFARFESILVKEDLHNVSNLIYYKDNLLHKGKIEFFSPADRIEYTTEIISEIQAFNSHFERNSVKAIPVEISRGCPFSCLHCSEPVVKGKRVRYRDLDVIEKEIQFLGRHGLNNLYFICSELKLENNTFVEDLADRIIKINETREPFEKVTWGALTCNLNLTPQEWKHLRKSGFKGGWYLVMSLDYENIKAVRAPYSSLSELIQNIHYIKQVIDDEKRNMTSPSIEECIYHNKNPVSYEVDSFLKKQWSLFLGGVPTTPDVIRETLKKINNEKFDQYFDSAWIIKMTRILNHQDPSENVIQNTWTMTPTGLAESYNELYPSFTYPPALMEYFKSINELEEFYTLLEDTFLSKAHLFKKDWNWFLSNYASPERFRQWWLSFDKDLDSIESSTSIPEVRKFIHYLSNNPDIQTIKLLFNPLPHRKKLLNHSAYKSILLVFKSFEDELSEFIKILGLPINLDTVLTTLAPYEITSILFKKFASKEELILLVRKLPQNKELIEFFTEYLLYMYNVPLRPDYQYFFSNPDL